MCENCILRNHCSGQCDDTNQTFYANQLENEERDSRPDVPEDYYGD